jgi:hypothetical protein
LGPADNPARYDVKLYFAVLAPATGGNRVFDVKLQGRTVLSRLDVGAGPAAAMVREIRDVAVAKDLLVEFSPSEPHPSDGQTPILSALEFLRRD